MKKTKHLTKTKEQRGAFPAAEPEAQKDEEKEDTQKRWKRAVRILGEGVAFVVIAFLLIWYCVHPEYYGGRGLKGLFSVRRTYLVMGAATVLLTICLLPNHLSERVNRVLGWIWFAAAPFMIYFSLYYLNAEQFSIHFFSLNKIAVAFTFWFLYLVLFALLLITGSIRVAVILPAIAVAALGIGNQFVISFRGMAISGGDLFSLKTAMTVASSYEYEIDWHMFAEIFLTFAICAISCKIRGFRPLHWKRRVLILGVWLILTGTFYHICCQTSFLSDHDIRSEGFSHQLRYKQFDMLFTTLCTCFYMVAEKPEGYSVEQVQEIAADYIGQASEGTTPNLIVIMNESLADYTEIGNGLEFSEDYMPFIHSLTENTIKGSAYASIFGANTPNSEYEFLTGNTMGFLPTSSIGFNAYVRGNMPSLASELKSLGYTTLAMHPYRGSNYRRNVVYPQIGFDTFYTRIDFLSAEYIRNFISDQTLMERIVKEYENNLKSGKPFFSYNVTVQNHGGYTTRNSKNLDDSITVLTPGVDKIKTGQYANLVKASDDAFRYLVEYFSEVEEPVVIVMFGDHQPSLGDSTYEYLIGNEDELTSEELMEKYKIPFIAWANYDIEEETIEKTSLNYLYSILADRLDLPMTGYQSYLRDLSEEIPVLAAGGYWTKDGDFYELNDQESPYFDKINEYHILEYNYILGGKNRCLELFNLE